MSPALALLWVALALHLAGADDATSPPTTTAEPKCSADCVRCSAAGCVRCAELLVAATGQCVKRCPLGTREGWARGERYMGRVCNPVELYSEVLIGLCAGVGACLLLGMCAAGYVACRPRRQRARPLPQSPPRDHRLAEFNKQLDALRPHAYTLLSVLNNTRRQVRELYLVGNNEAAMAYSCVLSDLAKILLLLNKSHIPVVPEEWPRLASWAERILKRYARVARTPTSVVSYALPVRPSPPLSTFKTPSYASSISDEGLSKELDIWKEDLRPPSYSLIESVPLSDPWETKPIVRRESVWIEDEDLKLARPQDELTTEL